MHPLCCRTVGTSVEGSGRTTAAFFDLDKTIISRSSTLAFAPAFYRLGLITRAQVLRGACAQLTFRLTGASHYRMERVRDQVSNLCRGWDAGQISQIVTDGLAAVIVPHVYAEARQLLDGHIRDGHDVLIASTSGLEIVAPIGAMLGACGVIATRLEVADGRYTGSVAYYAYGQAKADRVAELAAERGYQLADCFASAIRSQICRCSSWSGTPMWSTPTARCARWLAPAAGRCWPSLARVAEQRPIKVVKRAKCPQECNAAYRSTSRIEHAQVFSSSRIRSRKERRTAGPDTAARYPRATSRGRRAVAGEFSQTGAVD